jgi:hypothetical protein
MPKRPHRPERPPHHAAWSVRTGGMTPKGQSELMQQIGRQLQADYEDVLKEPAPERIKQLLERLEGTWDEEDPQGHA